MIPNPTSLPAKDLLLRTTLLVLTLCMFSCTQTGGTSSSYSIETPPDPSAGQYVEETDGWPREISTPKAIIVVYQPQPEKLDGDRLSVRAAVGLEMEGEDDPIFGAVWLDARLATDRANRTATIVAAQVTQVKLPEHVQKHSDELGKLLETEIPNWVLPISIDRLLTTLELAETRSETSANLSTKSPTVLFSDEPAVLISIDGKPILRAVEGASLMQVVNTPFTILLDLSSETYYLNADTSNWYQAKELHGAWSLSDQVPGYISERAPEADNTEQNDQEQEEPGPAPRIIVATVPTELIVAQGKPEFTPIKGTNLLYMSNSDSDVLMEVAAQKYFALLAGRWYTAPQLDGPWSYVAGDNLPADFSMIPEDSEMSNVLYSVPGTSLSKEAVLDAHVPQTAKIDRRTATLDVTFDGDARFEAIEETNMAYAINTEVPVIRSEGHYYAVKDGVWFESDAATGPWRVATSVPTEIYTIGPDSPIYYVTFVRIYKVTPDYVYVGYTPGYTNTYIYESTIVYGTGYSYPGWYGNYYYARPATWGFGVRYNPWSGWGFGFSYSNGPFTFGIGFGGRGGWWGPARYSGYRNGYRHGYRNGYNAGYRAGNYRGNHQNLYRNYGKASVADNPGRVNAVRESTKRANNVYADRGGQIHQKTQQGWQTRSDGNWQGSGNQVKQSQNLQRSSQARQRGANRTGAYRQARGSGRRRGP